MKMIKPSFEFIDERDALKKIELCGRVCYKSENRITDDSAEKFVKNVIERGHESVLEHVQIIMKISYADAQCFNMINKDIYNLFGWVNMLRMTSTNGRYIISGNVRMWRDFMRRVSAGVIFTPFVLLHGALFDDVNKSPSGFPTTAEIITADQLQTDIERDTHATETVRFIVDRGISHEIVRHRTASFSQESTRYCNYGGEITFITPPFACHEWVEAMKHAEQTYCTMIDNGLKPQQARAVLPNSTKTELIMTATRDCWKHFFELRTAAAAHPQMREIAIPLCEEMKRRWENEC